MENSNQEMTADVNSYSNILQTILPSRKDPYSLIELDEILGVKIDEIEVNQRGLNKFFEQVLDNEALSRIEFLRNSLHAIQLDLMKLQCDVAFTSEQLETIKTTFNLAAISERQALLEKEIHLKKSIRQVKFKPLKEFFSLLIKCLESTVDSCKRISKQQVVNQSQMFDWNLFQHIILLLRTCGKALRDLSSAELLFQSSFEIDAISFKYPINQIDFNHFVESYESYSLDTLLEVIVGQNGRIELGEMLSTSGSPESYTLFNDIHLDLKLLTVGCCRLLIDLNMNFIDNLLTTGICIDRLNGNENAISSTNSETQALPLYAFSPQEYITQIGQHLLTLRKQTQQFDSSENKSLKTGLEYLNEAQDIQIDVKSYSTVTEIIMRCFARLCIRSLLSRTNKSILNNLTLNGKRQLSTDALYLDNVLEDLNLLDADEPNVERFKALLVQ